MEPLDHVVINTLRDMDAGADLFSALGFTLTPRGHHTLGSINHLMVVPGAYLELVGVPDQGLQRQEVLDSPRGLNGLVFRSADAQATWQRLAALDLGATEPVAFSRPVRLTGNDGLPAREADARFRTVRLGRETFPGGRVYLCEHLTPDLVWREEWMSHPNRFIGFDHIDIDDPHPAQAARRYAAACDGAIGTRAGCITVRLDDGFEMRLRPGRAGMARLGLRFDGLSELARRARSLPGVQWAQVDDRQAQLSLTSLELTLTCLSR